MPSNDSDTGEIENLRREIVRLVLAELEQHPGKPMPVQLEQQALDALVGRWTQAVAPLEDKLSAIRESLDKLRKDIESQSSQIERLRQTVAALAGKRTITKTQERARTESRQSDGEAGDEQDSDSFDDFGQPQGHHSRPRPKQSSGSGLPRPGLSARLREHGITIAIILVVLAIVAIILRVTGFWGGEPDPPPIRPPSQVIYYPEPPVDDTGTGSFDQDNFSNMENFEAPASEPEPPADRRRQTPRKGR